MSVDNEICRMDAGTVAAKVKDKTLSAVEVTEAVLRRMETLEPYIHAFCTPTPDVARTAAAARRRQDRGRAKTPACLRACRSESRTLSPPKIF